MAYKGVFSEKKRNRLPGVIMCVFSLLTIVCVMLLLISQSSDEAEIDRPGYTEEIKDSLSGHTSFPDLTEENEITTSNATIPVHTETESLADAVPTEAQLLPTESTASDEEETEPQSAVIQEPVSQHDVDCYAAVIEQYQEVILMDSDEFSDLYNFESELWLMLEIDSLKRMVDAGEISSIVRILETPTLTDRFPYVAGRIMSSAKTYSYGTYFDPTVYHYAYYNINGLGSCELLISEYNDYRDDYSILAIYTLDDGEPKLLHSIPDNARWHLTIYTDGTICCDSSGSASIHYWNYYRIDNSFDIAEQIAGFTVDYSHPRGEYMAAAVDGYEAMLTPVTDIAWQPLQT